MHCSAEVDGCQGHPTLGHCYITLFIVNWQCGDLKFYLTLLFIDLLFSFSCFCRPVLAVNVGVWTDKLGWTLRQKKCSLWDGCWEWHGQPEYLTTVAWKRLMKVVHYMQLEERDKHCWECCGGWDDQSWRKQLVNDKVVMAGESRAGRSCWWMKEVVDWRHWTSLGYA